MARPSVRPRVSDPDMLRGTVKSIKKVEGYGFVTHTGTGEDYFFHRSAVRDSDVSFEDLRMDQEVEFLPSDGPKGLRASLVRVL